MRRLVPAIALLSILGGELTDRGDPGSTKPYHAIYVQGTRASAEPSSQGV